MNKVFSIIRNNRTWSGIVALLMVLGLGGYAPLVHITQDAVQGSLHFHCENNPDDTVCLSEE